MISVDRRAWSDGPTGLRMTELEFVHRLAALVPLPPANMLVYHGVFGPAAAWRDAVVPTPPEAAPSLGRLRRGAASSTSRRYQRWGDLLWHVFGIEGFACPDCGEQMVVRAAWTHLGAVVRAADRPSQGTQPGPRFR